MQSCYNKTPLIIIVEKVKKNQSKSKNYSTPAPRPALPCCHAPQLALDIYNRRLKLRKQTNKTNKQTPTI
jgi:hypothetical protein